MYIFPIIPKIDKYITLGFCFSFIFLFLDLEEYWCCCLLNLGLSEWKWRCYVSSWCSTCSLLFISYHVFDLVLAGIISTGSFSLYWEIVVSKSASNINFSSIVSCSVLSIASGGNGLIWSTCRLAVPVSVADLLTYLQIILPLSSSINL